MFAFAVPAVGRRPALRHQRRRRLSQRPAARRGRHRQRAAARAASRPTARGPRTGTDQQPLYDGLLYASPTLTHDDVAKYFKDATFGVQATATSHRPSSPRPGVTIVRDKQLRRPAHLRRHRADVEFGAGYAGAAGPPVPDGRPAPHRPRAAVVVRRRLGGQPRDGPHAVGDRALHRGRPAEADRPRARASTAPRRAAGRSDVNAFVAGINAYIDEALLDPTQAAGRVRGASASRPSTWKVTDVIAEASLIGGIFGKGGGNEVRSRAAAPGAARSASARRRGRRAWADFRSKNDPEAPTTVLKKRFPLRDDARRSPKRGLALPDPGSVTFDAGRARRSRARRARATARSARSCVRAVSRAHAARLQLGARQRRASRPPATRSACSARRSATTCRRS